MSRELHIVCFDCPTPADYGGAIDIFYCIKALYNIGIKIHLHYFKYNERVPDALLMQYCATINSYKREIGSKGFRNNSLYIVRFRINNELIHDLKKDSFPILIEGIHCTGILASLGTDRKVLIRLQNDEYEYFKQLARFTNSLLKKLFFKRESRLLQKYQSALPKEYFFACITEKEVVTFNNKYGLKNVIFIPAFISTEKVNCLEGIGDYCLYHGNLANAENEAVAIWLIEKVFSSIRFKLIIAGKDPSRRLRNRISAKKNVQLLENPTDLEMDKLISEAHINVLPSFSSTGIKFKLIHALLKGRHCIVNEQMIYGSGLEEACYIGNAETAIASLIVQLQHTPFTEEEIKLRKRIFNQRFNNDENCKNLIKYLW